MLTNPGGTPLAPTPAPLPLRIVLIGNYPRDGQESMQRFAQMLRDGLQAAGIPTDLVLPPVVLGRFGASTLFGIGKWLGYLDKYLIFPAQLRLRLRSWRSHRVSERLVVHICDHGNAMYYSATCGAPLVITCHDLLAVRGALGEDTDCPASTAGRLLQQWILRGLGHATVVCSVSTATRHDVDRLVKFTRPGARSVAILSDLNHSFRPLPATELDTLLAAIPALAPRYVLHVGSNLRRKNREGVLRIFARTVADWDAQLVFAGQPLSPALRDLAASLGIEHRILEVAKPSNDLLTALYNRATAFLFPSRFEGFGWPIIEAQACGCPVLCSRTGPFPEVAGDAGLTRDIDDEAGFAYDLLTLRDPAVREQWSVASLANARRFSAGRMLSEHLSLYRSLFAAR